MYTYTHTYNSRCSYGPSLVQGLQLRENRPARIERILSGIVSYTQQVLSSFPGVCDFKQTCVVCVICDAYVNVAVIVNVTVNAAARYTQNTSPGEGH